MRGNTMSSAKRVCPVHLARASTLRNGLPTTCNGSTFRPLRLCLPSPFDPLFVTIDTFCGERRGFAAHACGGEFDRFVDFDVAGAATEIAAQGFFDLCTRRIGLLREQFFRHEHEAGRAITALRRARIGEGLLQRMQETFADT